MNHEKILEHYFASPVGFNISLFGNGLIHQTYLLSENGSPSYILQEINTAVFKQPQAIENNLERLASYLKEKEIASC